MPQTHEITAYAQRLILEYNRARKLLRKYFKKRHDPDEARAEIKEIIDNMAVRQSKIIGYTLNDAFRKGAKEGSRKTSNATISAAASSASMGFDLTKVADTHLKNITQSNIGHVGKFNSALTNQLQLEYKTLLADNKLVNTLNKSGWSPAIEKALVKKGTSAEVIALAKGQSTTNKIINVLEHNGIRGGMHPNEVSRLLQPAISNYFGPEGVVIDNVGKFKKVLKVDADGNYKYVKQAVTRPYTATPKSYANLLARTSMIQAHHEGRYQSLQKTGLVDYYISVSVLDANTCDHCAMMHGQRVTATEGPLYHPSCACDRKPIWKKDSGLKNKDPAIYEKQRDQHFWKQHQLAEYNKKMPRGAKLKFHSMLPKDALTAMPDKAAMRTIRYNALGKPGAITPKTILKKVVKPAEVKEKGRKKVERVIEKKIEKKVVKKDTLAQMKKKERETADELWKKTTKDGNEHIKITNSKTIYADGEKHHVRWTAPETPFKAQHTHPNWDCPLSEGDITNLLTIKNMSQTGAASSKNIYLAIKRADTIIPNESKAVLRKKICKLSDELTKKGLSIYKKKYGHTPSKPAASRIYREAITETNKRIAKEYNFDYVSFRRKP